MICKLQCTWTPYNKIKKKRQYKEKNCPRSKKTVLASEYCYTCVNSLLFIFSRKFITWKLSSDRVTFQKKLLLAKIAFLFFSIPLCYLLNMSSLCIGSISWCCFVVPLLCWYSLLPLFCDIPIVLPVFRCSISIPPLIRCSVSRCSVFRCSWFYSMPINCVCSS